jgi:hypothetical protein
LLSGIKNSLALKGAVGQATNSGYSGRALDNTYFFVLHSYFLVISLLLQILSLLSFAVVGRLTNNIIITNPFIVKRDQK